MAGQTVSLQAEHVKHDRVVVFTDCGAHILPGSAGHRKPGCQFLSRLNMKAKRIIYIALMGVLAVALFAIFYLYVGSTVPDGQQPLVHLNASNLDSLKKSFNESADSVRVMVMLSPT